MRLLKRLQFGRFLMLLSLLCVQIEAVAAPMMDCLHNGETLAMAAGCPHHAGVSAEGFEAPQCGSRDLYDCARCALDLTVHALSTAFGVPLAIERLPRPDYARMADSVVAERLPETLYRPPIPPRS